MDYFKEHLLTEDLIDDLGFKSDKSKWKNLASNIWGTFKAITRLQDLFEFTDKGKYEDFLVKGFQDVIKQRGSNTVKVTYRKTLYVITSVEGNNLILTGISQSVKGKTVSLPLSKVKVAKAQEGATGYETLGSYEYLRDKLNQPVIFLLNGSPIQCIITQATASRVVLKDDQDLIANINLESHIVYPNEQGVPTIANAKIIFAIIDMVGKKGKDGEETPDYSVDKTLFNVKYDEQTRNPFRSDRSDEFYNEAKNLLNKICNLIFVETGGGVDTENVDVKTLPIVRTITGVTITRVTKDKITYSIPIIGQEKPLPVSLPTDIILETLGGGSGENDPYQVYYPASALAQVTGKLGNKQVDTDEDKQADKSTPNDTNFDEGEFDFMTPEQKAKHTTSLMRFKRDQTDVTLDIDSKKSKVKVKDVIGDKVTLVNDQNQDLVFDIDRIISIDEENIFILSKEEAEDKQNEEGSSTTPKDNNTNTPPPPGDEDPNKKEATLTYTDILYLLS